MSLPRSPSPRRRHQRPLPPPPPPPPPPPAAPPPPPPSASDTAASTPAASAAASAEASRHRPTGRARVSGDRTPWPNGQTELPRAGRPRRNHGTGLGLPRQ